MFYPKLQKVKDAARQLGLLAKELEYVVDNIEEGRSEQNFDTVETYTNELNDVSSKVYDIYSFLSGFVPNFMRDNGIKKIVINRGITFKFDM